VQPKYTGSIQERHPTIKSEKKKRTKISIARDMEKGSSRDPLKLGFKKISPYIQACSLSIIKVSSVPFSPNAPN
jgi:hypothetical protein